MGCAGQTNGSLTLYMSWWDLCEERPGLPHAGASQLQAPLQSTAKPLGAASAAVGPQLSTGAGQEEGRRGSRPRDSPAARAGLWGSRARSSREEQGGAGTAPGLSLLGQGVVGNVDFGCLVVY